MKKLIRDGKVAVVYSPGYGAGWSTWNPTNKEMIFDPIIVEYVLVKKYTALKDYMDLTYPDNYADQLENLVVCWVLEGTLFRINEYDGAETIEIKEEMPWITA